MRSRHSFGIAWAVMLGIATMLGAGAANAVLDADEPGPAVVYAKEALLSTSTLAASDANDTRTYYRVANDVAPAATDADAVLDIDMRVTIAASSTPIFLRYDLENMVLGENSTAANFKKRPDDDNDAGLRSDISMGEVLYGGEAGGKYVVYAAHEEILDSVTLDNLSLDEGEAAIFAPVSLGILPDTPGSITVSLYTDADDALRGTGDPEQKMRLDEAVKVSPSLETLIDHTVQTADIDTGFTAFLGRRTSIPGGEHTVVLGALGVSVADGALKPESSQQAGLSDVLTIDTNDGDPPGGTVEIEGDFTFGTFEVWAGNPACSDIGLDTPTPAANKIPLVPNPAETRASLSLAGGPAFNAFVHPDNASGLCVTIPTGNSKVIREGRYHAKVAFDAVAGAAFPPATVSGLAGEIDRLNTVVHVPYLTTYPGHSNRIIITNRAQWDIVYDITYTPEAGTTATPGPDSTGTVMSKSTRVLSVAGGSVVTLTGKTKRTAATIGVTGSKRDTQVSTVIVNREDGSTDTVVYVPAE